MKIPRIYEEKVGAMLAVILQRGCAKKRTIATAESCTGGMVSAFLTDLAGSSEVYLGGASVYSNLSKVKLLGVSKDLIDACGAVSSEVAAAMAEGIRNTLSSSVGVSITGIAGPGGATAEKPVGMVWLGISSEAKSYTRLLELRGSRQEIRYQAAFEALTEVLNVL